MRRWARAVLIAAFIGACSNSLVRIDTSAAVNGSAGSPERFVIVAVQNDSSAFSTRAGGTPRDYGMMTAYGPTSRARRLMRSLQQDYHLREVRAWPIDALHVHCAVLEIPDGADRTTLLAELSGDPRIKVAQALQTFTTRTEDYNDPYIGLQHGFHQMNVAEAQRWSRGESVKVAVIDTGADIRHPDLAASIAVAANFVDGDSEQFRRDRHGTEIAGVIAAVANNREGIVGVAPAARLLVLKACWQIHPDADAANCNSYTLARALAAALEAHAQVVNLSLAGPEDPLLSGLIREGLRRGILFVAAAAGAFGSKENLMHQPGVLEVSSAGSHSAIASALYAPGREILTLLPNGHYDFATGDSIATAQVTGIVALLLAKNEALSPAAAYKLLRDTTTPMSADGDDSGHVDACAAVVALVARGSCTPSTRSDHMVAEK